MSAWPPRTAAPLALSEPASNAVSNPVSQRLPATLTTAAMPLLPPAPRPRPAAPPQPVPAWNPTAFRRAVRAAVLAGASSLALLAWPAAAHDGEDHSAPPTQPLPAAVAPRASAQTPDFELVAVHSGSQPATLTVYLDTYAGNQPVAGAEVEVESGAYRARGQAVAPGVYRFDAAGLAQPGTHPLTFTVSTAQASDLLDAKLVLSAPGGGAPARAAGPVPGATDAAGAPGLALGTAAALATLAALLAGAAGLALGRRRPATPFPPPDRAP